MINKLAALIWIFTIVTSDCKSEDNVLKCFSAIVAAPAWSETCAENIHEVNEKLLPTLMATKTLNEVEMDDLLQRLLKYRDEIRDRIRIDSKLYILNRVYFLVPDAMVPRRNVPRFGGWIIPPQNDVKEISALWPLSLDAQGNLQITGIFQGYAGPPYSALKEFEYFSKTYKKRSASDLPVAP